MYIIKTMGSVIISISYQLICVLLCYMYIVLISGIHSVLQQSAPLKVVQFKYYTEIIPVFNNNTVKELTVASLTASGR